MRKVGLLAVAVTLVMSALAGSSTTMRSRAQSLPAPASCNGTFTPAPMAGHYTGAWHSDGDYHFAVFNTDLRLQIIIDGTLDLTVGARGEVTGTASGKLDAPITHDGARDVSSGYGTISGQVTGFLVPGDAGLTLHHPVIAMQWGTFVGGGYTVPRSIPMPDYTLAASTFDCITGAGSIAEQNFPTQAVVADGAGQMSYAAGIGSAGGTWHIAGDNASTFTALSTRIDAFTASVGGALDTNSYLNAADLDRIVLQPLRDLHAAIAAQPLVATCLLERLAAWEARVIPLLVRSLPDFSGTPTLTTLRQASDTVRTAGGLNIDCGFDIGSWRTQVINDETSALDRALGTHDWPAAVLLWREALLLGGDASRPALQQHVNASLHTSISEAGSQSLVPFARMAYALGDDTDAQVAYNRLAVHTPVVHPTPVPTSASRKSKKKRGKTPNPTSTATPRPTSTPKPKSTLVQQLTHGIQTVNVLVAGGSTPGIQWSPVPGATRYVVVAFQGKSAVWTWSGSTTAVNLGDTTIEGLAHSGNDGWPVLGPGSVVWSILALDSHGTVVGVHFRVAG